MRAYRKLLFLAAVFLLAAIALVFLLFDVNKLRGPIQSQMQTGLNRQVDFGSMRLRLFPLSVAVERLEVGEDPAFGAERPFLSAKEFAVSTNLLSLLRGDVSIDSVRIVEPAIELIRSAEGRWNASSLGTGAGSSGGSSKPFSLAELRIQNGAVAITDGQARRERAEYRQIDLTLRDFAAGRPVQLEGAVHLPENLSLKLKAKALSDRAAGVFRIESLEAALGGLKVSASGTVATSAPAALDLQVNSRDASIAEAARVAAAFGSAFAPGMKVTGMVNANLLVKGTTARPEVTGQITAGKLEMAAPAWKIPVRIPEIRLDITPASLKSNRFAAQCGGTQLEGALSVTNYNSPDAFLAASISTGQAKLDELLHIAGGFGIPAAATMDGQGAVSLNVRVMGKIRSNAPLGYSGSGYLRNATLQLPALNKPVRVTNADLRFEQESAVLENLSLHVATTTLKGSASVKRFSAPEIRFNAEADQVIADDLRGLVKEAPASKSSRPPLIARMTGTGTAAIGRILYNNVALTQVRAACTLDRGIIRLDPLTAELFGGRHTGAISIDSRTEAAKISLQSKIEQVDANTLLSCATSIKKILYGLLSADVNLSFVSKPGEDLARTLNGAFSLRMAEGKLTGINLLNELARIAQALGFAQKSEPATNIVKLTAALDIKDGVASTNDLRMDFHGGSLAATGVIGLADQTLKLRMTPVLSRQSSEQFGGGKVAGIMNTVLSNKNGELVIPVLVGGTFAQPRLVPDAEQMAKMKLQGLAPLQGVIGVITGQGGKKEEAAPGETGRKIGESLIDLLKKRKQ